MTAGVHGKDPVYTVEIVRRRLADGRTIADADVHTLVAEIDRLRSAMCEAIFAADDDDAEAVGILSAALSNPPA